MDMEKRFNRNSSIESRTVALQKKLAEARRPTPTEPQPVSDLTDFMNDMFFGTVKTEKKTYNLTGSRGSVDAYREKDVFDSSTRSTVSSRLTREWLEESKGAVASSPSRLVSSPRFAAASPALPSLSSLDKRDPLSRSARRHREVEGFVGDILSKSAILSRNKSENIDQPSPAAAVHRWFSDILKPSNGNPPPSADSANQFVSTLPPRLSAHRKSRFQIDPNGTQQQTIPSQQPAKRTFKTIPTSKSPPKNLIESAHRRSISSSTCSVRGNEVLSPPRNLVESAGRRSVSSSTCSTNKISKKPTLSEHLKDGDQDLNGEELNVFLKEQRIKIRKILRGDVNGKAKIVLSEPSNSTSSMVAAICYSWLLEFRMKKSKEGGKGDGNEVVTLPVMNMSRGKMLKQRQAAWLFHHVGLDATALLFSDEVDLETLMMSRKLNMLVVGQEILRTNGEVGSQCTIITDNYCEDAYELLQTPVLKKLLLAGIILDTHNLNMSLRLSKTRDAEAVQLLSEGSTPNYRNAFYEQLIDDQRDGNFFEVLQNSYGRLCDESSCDSGTLQEQMPEKKTQHKANVENSEKNSNDIKNARTNTVPVKSAKPKPVPTQDSATAQAGGDASRGKNKFFLAKWFGFGK